MKVHKNFLTSLLFLCICVAAVNSVGEERGISSTQKVDTEVQDEMAIELQNAIDRQHRGDTGPQEPSLREQMIRENEELERRRRSGESLTFTEEEAKALGLPRSLYNKKSKTPVPTRNYSEQTRPHGRYDCVGTPFIMLGILLLMLYRRLKVREKSQNTNK